MKKKESLYQRVLAICNKQGKSIRSIERNANLATGTISKWKTASPTINNLQAVAKVLDVDINELIKTTGGE